MKKVIMTIKVPKTNQLKETEEQRRERLQYSQRMVTKTVPNKKKKSRAQLKSNFNREVY